MLLSIIIPVYNVEKYIADCLDSICNQISDSDDWVEIVCVDDGSIDNSGLFLDEYKNKHPWIKISVYHKSNGGVSHARNFGIDKASGQYVWFFDSDDVMLDGSLCLFRPFLDGNYQLISGLLDYCSDGYIYKKDRIRKSFFINRSYHYTSCILRSLIINNGLYYKQDLKYGEDLLFFELIKCFAKKTKNLHYSVYLYRNRNGSAMSYVQDYYLNCLYKRLSYYDDYLRVLEDKKSIKYLKDRKNEVVRNIIFHDLLSKTKDFGETINALKQNNLYPYTFIWSDILVFHNIKDAMIKYFCFLFPFEPYLRFVNYVLHLRYGKQ